MLAFPDGRTDMRIAASFLIPALALPALASAAPRSDLDGADGVHCMPAASVARTDRGVESGVQRLGALPDAAEIKTVYRTVDSCPRAVVGRDRIGSNPAVSRPRIDALPRAIATR